MLCFQWLSLVAIIWLQAINGTNSNFPAYSSHLKSLLSGLAAAHLLLIGSLLGYGLQFLLINHNPPPILYCHVFILTFAVVTSLIRVWPLVVVVGIGALMLLPVMVPVVERVKCWIVDCEVKVFDLGGRGGKWGGIDAEEIGFLVYLLGATVGLVYLNNLGQIAESRGCLRISSLVSLASAFGCFGRLFPSLVDYFFPKMKNMIPSATAMGVMTSPMCVAFIILAVTKHDVVLYASTAIIGICTGAITSISVSATTELFGTKNFGLNHNILISNIPIGSFLFGYFAALLYNKEKVHGQEVCMGDKCYKTTFLIWASFCAVAILLAFLLHLRTKKAHS